MRLIVLVVVVGFLLRAWAAWQLPVDFDEPTYMEAGYKYAQLIQAGDITGIIDYPGVNEHPPLVKLIYGLTFLVVGRGADWTTALFLSRSVSVVFGSLGVLVLALIDPLAGGFLAVQTLAVKYTSQAYLEALPLFFSLLSVALLLRFSKAKTSWFFLSAAALGLAGAGKYSYFPIVFVIFYILVWERHQRLGKIVLYFVLAGIVFFCFNPYMWHSTISRFVESTSFHIAYSQGSHVQEVNYPWYQSFVWVARSHGFIWHPDVFFYLGIDGLIFLFALPGAWLEWKGRRWVDVWLVTSMLALLLWPTKWPQYTLVVIPAFCLAASTAVKKTYEFLREQELYWEWLHNMFPKPSRGYVIIASILLGVLIFGALASQVLIAVNKIGWSEMTTGTSGLPDNAINDILALPDGRMLVATNNGVGFWRAANKDEIVDEWMIFNHGNSSLPDQRVISIALDQHGIFWFGTLKGLASFNGTSWSVFGRNDFGLDDEQVNTIAVDGQNNVWIGTLAGAAVYNGMSWRSITNNSAGLVDNAVFSIAVEKSEQHDNIWFGTLSGVSVLNPSSGHWKTFTRQDIDLGWGGVSDLMFDSKGILWVCTEGGGISLWDGKDWSYLKVSNSKLPYSTIETVAELEPGEFWIAASIPNTAGGVLARYDGERWYTYRKGFTGYSGAETVVITKDSSGKYWFGTRNDGIDTFEPKR